MTSARILADSINPAGDRITSWLLKYWLPIHGEFMTHRVFGRNTASSRAIPFKKMLSSVLENPGAPEKWGAEQKGMQAGDSLTGNDLKRAQDIWRAAMLVAVEKAEELHGTGLHKSIVNRLLMPFAHVTVLATTSQHPNFYALRAHKDAEPTFQVLAYSMLHAWRKSDPVQRAWGEWHGPWMDQIDPTIPHETAMKIVTARCARLSYLTFDGESNVEKDVELHDKLLASEPKHASPAEHICKAEESFWTVIGEKAVRTNYSVHGNDQGQYNGWTPYRKMLPGETTLELDYERIIDETPDWIRSRIGFGEPLTCRPKCT